MEDVHPLRAYRETQEPPLSQNSLAEKLGVVRETVARWESGTRKIDEQKLSEVSRVTGIPAAQLRPDLAELLRAAE